LGRSLVGGSPALEALRQAVESATQQALGMMAGRDTRVVSREPSVIDGGLAASTIMTLTSEGVAVRMVLRCDVAGAKTIAAGVLGVPADELSTDDGLATLGELANVVAGRVRSSTGDGQAVSFTLPSLVVDAIPGAAPEVGLTVAAVDGSFHLLVEMAMAAT